MAKHCFDVVLSAMGLTMLSALILSLAAAIKLTSPGPVFYRGERIGRFGTTFRIFKFRSMVVNAEQIGRSSTSDDDPRITRIGAFMRKCKLDELPQLLNVLFGDMSLVGPRPEIQKYVDLYTDDQKVLLELRPGITDWASIWNSDEGAVLVGSEDPDRAYEELIRPAKLNLQLLYAGRHSVAIDVKIILFTIAKLFTKDIVPKEIREVLVATGTPDLKALIARRNPQSKYSSVTELPGQGATKEQISMMHTRYRFATDLADSKDVLELACGPGIGLGTLGKKAHRVVGGDIESSLIKLAKQHYGDRVTVECIDAQQLPFDDASFDVILLLEAIYYLPNPEQFVAETRRVLRPSGSVFICSANCERPNFNPSPFTNHYFSAGELKQLLTDHEFDVQLYGGYPVGERGLRSRLLGAIRRVAVALHLVPKTMAWKIRIKRLLFGRLDPILAEIELEEQKCQELIPLDAGDEASRYKVIYAVGRRAA